MRKATGSTGRMGLVFFLGLLFLFGVILFASASPQNKISLRVSPLYYDLTVNPGEEKSGKLLVENVSEQNIDISVEFSDFFVDESGKYVFPEKGDQMAFEKYRLFSMRDWFRVRKSSFALGKGRGETVDFTIAVPADANLGGHYGAVFFRTNCRLEEDKAVVSTDKSQVCVSGRPGVLFLVQAGGEVQKSARLKKADIPGISFADAENLKIELENTGNTHFKPEGEVVAKNLAGKEIFRLDVKDKTILPGVSRDFSGKLERKDFWGIYKILGSVRDGDGREIKFSRWTFLVPWREILVLAGLVLAWIWFLRKFRLSKKKN